MRTILYCFYTALYSRCIWYVTLKAEFPAAFSWEAFAWRSSFDGSSAALVKVVSMAHEDLFNQPAPTSRKKMRTACTRSGVVQDHLWGSTTKIIFPAAKVAGVARSSYLFLKPYLIWRLHNCFSSFLNAIRRQVQSTTTDTPDSSTIPTGWTRNHQ